MTLFLIAHKVRGAPAFDIAEEIAPGLWIIPTSGWRCRPYWATPLDDILSQYPPDNMPDIWPDHYPNAHRKTDAQILDELDL